ncbi:MAG: hypothetical protein A2921_01675 [Candidatus Magasanikbacteria bacterium RIFCSPLOWO2_01_FULL_43_20b]|uniref:Type II toxin-antitoxin system mRNA interferase toxin, RelE/StbE family n=1 Tax=Candidatus Magasanikbacteria bacterium RIFCSPLOWO2_12_FULL_43_12 TaxID=1798692 RepID=A0A1F6MVH7_9BACT|nr:MAG: hypothetical protein A3C74_03125 [Candidatus Magasanikbacteria bacterium RIFCSPHIGHO2_02_FULL_44_13]OGH71683.1 MAG: hypothetical protein A3I93_02240 [Candidatus Magasanikbacteria bacterium RIFCSPLOWO2_02_FULL_43_22]OGH73202.1 MAG: hypothetical protein A2921_01675 [Candidatus Magasanikbacteria bacterium RIFCSPLOWO2_01_FULL_43_20b]OGH75705.1 MAG: hypothetical protein A3G00_03095 [Candidatus Magasanikbacteria bacterium RIFCSPLOWO2_12_FULL_43_12]
MNINFSPRFKRAYKKLPPRIQDDFDKQMKVFMRNPNHPSLKTHKLKGRLQECFVFRLQNGYRVLFDFIASDSVDLLDAGSHDIYKKR